MRNRTGDVRKALQPVFDQLDDLVTTFESRHVGVVLWIINEIRSLHRPAKIGPVMKKCHDHHIAAFGAEYASWVEIGHMPTDTSWLNLATARPDLMHVNFMKVVVHVEQSHIEMLTSAGAITVTQSSKDSQSSMHTSADVTETN